MMECTHEEADTRVMVHLLHAVENGSANVEVQTVGTDIVVLLIGHFFNLHENHPNIDLWVAFGVGKNFQYIHINSICNDLGREQSHALPILHAFSGCDTTSSFCVQGKKSVMRAWKSYPEVTDVFLNMQEYPFKDELRFATLLKVGKANSFDV